MNRPACVSLIGLALAAFGSPSSAEAVEPGLAQRAYSILMTSCYRCHGIEKKVEGFDVSQRDTLLSDSRQYIVPKDLEKSQLWTRVGDFGDMPPQGSPERERFTAGDAAVLKQWIEAGAEFPPPEQPRTFLDERHVLSAIEKHLAAKVDRESWKHQRYFSLAHLYNHPKVTDYHLRLYRAALSKVINSLSRKPGIVLPEAVDAEQTVYSLDLRKVGWTDTAQWLQVLQEYPFGLEWTDKSLNDLAESVNERLGGGNRLKNRIPYVRADWFVARASRPPLYDTLLALPETEASLEAELGVTFQEDFNNDTLVRAAFTQSGVSRHNRLVDRHVGRSTGYYYRSHDFGKSFDRALLARFPLGPKFEGNRFADQAYEQDGGEIVFRLPNGLQGYMIVNAKGDRVSEAPVEIVRDRDEISGSPVVVNGISCMGCHRHGIQPYRDNVRQFVVLGRDAGDKVQRLYRDGAELDELLRADRDSFLSALERTIGPFLKQAEHQDKEITFFPEPVREVAVLYNGGLGLEEAAFELGHKPAELRSAISSAAFQEMGLGPLLAKDNRIPREMWDSKFDRGASLFQAVARELGSAIPLTIPKNSNE